jgi:hypothetical protein
VGGVNLCEYQIAAARSSQWQRGSEGFGGELHRAYGAISLAGESGEVIDCLKKHDFNGHPIDREKLLEEAGDTMWSLACVADASGVALHKSVLDCTGLGLVFPSLRLAALCGRVIGDVTKIGWSARIDIGACVTALEKCITPHGLTIEDACAHNVAKLLRRYPNGYSDADSIARRDTEGAPTAKLRAVATVEKTGVSTAPGPMEGE